MKFAQSKPNQIIQPQPQQPIDIFNSLKSIDPSTALFIVLVGLSVFLIALEQNLNGAKRGKTADARWANRGDLARCGRVGRKAIKSPRFNKASYYISQPIGAPPPAPNKIGRNTLFFPSINRSVIVFGAPGAGKTANFINPALMSAIRQGFPIVLWDYKFFNEGQAEKLIPFALENGYKIRVLVPGSSMSLTFNILDRIKDHEDVAMAREIVKSIRRNLGVKDAKKDAFFDGGGERILVGALLLAKWVAKVNNDNSSANILFVNQFLAMSNLSKRLEAHQDKIPVWILSELSVLTASAANAKGGKNATESGLLGTAISILAPMILPNYLDSFVGETTFPCIDPSDPLKVEGKVLVVLGIDKSNKETTTPIVATVMEQIVSHNFTFKRKDPLVVSLDELPTIVLPILDWLNQERSSGGSFILGAQHLGQLEDVYGTELAKGFMTGCANHIWFNPQETKAAEQLSESLGKKELVLSTDSKSFNSGKNSSNSKSISDQRHQVSLMPPEKIQTMPPGTCIIQCPDIGTKQATRIPLFHRFAYDDKKASQFNENCAAQFKKLEQIGQKRNKEKVDYGLLMRGYAKLLNELLPAPEAVKAPPAKKPPLFPEAAVTEGVL
jgi:type IV secretion system protein VirD4